MSEIRYTPSDEATLIDGYVVFWRKMKPLGVGLYLAGINNVPVVAPSLFWVSGLVYHWVPSLNDLSSSQVRRALTSGQPIGSLVGADVAAYIHEHELYGRTPATSASAGRA